MTWLILIPILLMFAVPFMFKIKEYKDVKVIGKETYREGLFIYYYFTIEKNGNKQKINVSPSIYNSVQLESIVTLYYNSGSERVTSFKSALES